MEARKEEVRSSEAEASSDGGSDGECRNGTNLPLPTPFFVSVDFAGLEVQWNEAVLQVLISDDLAAGDDGVSKGKKRRGEDQNSRQREKRAAEKAKAFGRKRGARGLALMELDRTWRSLAQMITECQ